MANSTIENELVNYLNGCVVDKDILGKINNYLIPLSIYIEMFHAWNKTHNIASHKFSSTDIIDLVIDSIVGGYFIYKNNTVFDAGAGGGFPSIPMAIIYSDTNFYLIEADRKKCSFLRTIKARLALNSVSISQKRIETCKNLPYIISKAAFSPKNIGLLCQALAPEGKLALWATVTTAHEYEIEAKKHHLFLIEKHQYELPNNKKRLIIIFARD